MTHSHRISLGLNLKRPMWKPENRLVFAGDVLTNEDSIEFKNATAIIQTNRPAEILCLIAPYAEGRHPALRWINVGQNVDPNRDEDGNWIGPVANENGWTA